MTGVSRRSHSAGRVVFGWRESRSTLERDRQPTLHPEAALDSNVGKGMV
jgi:hypothetical protein